MNNFSRKLARTVVAGALAAVAVVVSAPAASAAARDGRCDNNEFCLYWGGGSSVTSLSDFAASLGNYGETQPTCYEFKTPGLPGYGECIKNNAVKACNLRSRAVRVYFNSYHQGPYDTIPAESCHGLSITFLNNASHLFL